LGQEKFDEAYSAFLETTERWPDFASAHHYLGKIDMKRHDFKKAEEALRKASGLDSLKIDLLNEFALVLEHNGRIQESIEIFERMDRLDSKIVGLKNKIGELAFHIGEKDKAKEYFQLEIKRYPKDAIAYSNLGAVLAGEGKVEQALTYLSKSLEINPHDERTRKNYIALQQSS
jgi:tetratricopeptide (TPR) repeat protein